MVRNGTIERSLATGIRIVEVRVRNFRSLKSVNVPLAQMTILIGENNSGKTSFLEAMYAAIGGVRRGLDKDDIYTTAGETAPPKDRHIIVDLLIRPTSNTGSVVSTFPAGGFWTKVFGNGIGLDESENDFVAIRTSMEWEQYDADYKVERGFLREWLKDPSKIETASIDTTSSVRAAREPLTLFFMNAKRDIVDDMRRHDSIWGKLTSDLGLTEDQTKGIEDSLSTLNTKMINNSAVLGHMTSDLQVLNDLVAGEDNGVEISPIARTLRDLTKGIGLDFTTRGSQTFPLSRHGMGTKSLAAVLVFRAFVNWRVKNAQPDKIHPTLALEEPEAHLHPQAQRALITQVTKMPGQVIVSTHSPYVVAQTPIVNLRHFSKDGPDTAVSVMNIDDLSQKEIERINRFVINTRGEILFSRAMILFEGATEEYALPIFANKWWGKNPHMYGISFVGVGGAGNYLPYLRMAVMCHIPWYIFADGEPGQVENLIKQLEKIGISDISQEENIFVIPKDNNFEKYLVADKYDDVICDMLNNYHESDDYMADYIAKNHGQKLNKKEVRNYKSDGGRERAIVDALSNQKVIYAKLLANRIVELKNEKRRCPSLVEGLLEQMSADLNLSNGLGDK